MANKFHTCSLRCIFCQVHAPAENDFILFSTYAENSAKLFTVKKQRQNSATQEKSSSAAAEDIKQIAQAQVRTGIAAKGESTEVSRLLPVCSTTMFDHAQHPQILLIVRFHADSPTDVFQSRHLVAETIVGQGAEVIPAGISLAAVAEGIQRLPVPSELDIPERSLLVGISLLRATIALLLTLASKGIVIAAIAVGCLLLAEFVRILDLLVGRIDFLHFLGSHFVTGI